MSESVRSLPDTEVRDTEVRDDRARARPRRPARSDRGAARLKEAWAPDLIRTYARRNALVLGGQIAVAVKGFLMVRLLVMAFGTEEYGIYVLLIGLVGFVLGISSLGAGYRFTRHAPSTDDRSVRRTLFYGAFLFNLVAVAALSAALLVTHPLLERLLLKGRFPFPIWPVVLFLVAQTLLHHYSNYFRHTHRVRVFVLMTTADAYLFMALVYLFARADGGLSAGRVLMLQAAVAAAVAAVPILLAAREMKYPHGLVERYDVRADLRLGLPVVAMFVVEYALSNSDRLVLAVFAPLESVGAYHVAYVLGTVAIMIPKALGVAVPALLARAADTAGPDQVRRLMSVSLRVVLVFTVPYAVGTAVYGWDVLALFTTRQIANAAYPATVAAAVAIVFYGLFTVRGFLLYVKQRTVALLVVSATAAGVNLVLNVALLPIYPSILVPALTTLAAYAVADAIARRATASDEGPKVPVSFLIRVGAASAGIAAFRPFVGASSSPVVVMACVAASGLLYLALLVAFGAVPRNVSSLRHALRGSSR